MKTTALSQQSLFDIALQTAGNAEAAFDLALTAGDLSLTDEPTSDRVFTPVTSAIRNIVSYYADHRLTPATWITDEDDEEGVDFWCVEYNFVAS